MERTYDKISVSDFLDFLVDKGLFSNQSASKLFDEYFNKEE